MSRERYIVFQIEGGMGKNLVATAVIRAISQAHPERKILIVTAYPMLWECNPRVHRIFSFSEMQYFYEDYVEGKDTIFFLHEPYRQTDYINRSSHLSRSWCDLCGVEWSGDRPEMYFTKLESDFVESILKKDRPMLLMQPFGGASGFYSWARDIAPGMAQEIADELSRDFRIMVARREDQLMLNNTESLTMNPRQLALALMLSDKRLLIDSYLQHASAALGIGSTVVWIGNSPKVLGYETNENICMDVKRGSLRSSVYEPYDIMGNPVQLATPPDILFDKERIIQSILK